MCEPRRPDTIPGYEHPENNSTISRNTGIYKTFTEGKKPKKNEKFGNTQGKTQYSIISTESIETCPECSQSAVYICNCAFSDKRCDKGHIWYTDRSGQIKIGNPH